MARLPTTLRPQAKCLIGSCAGGGTGGRRSSPGPLFLPSPLFPHTDILDHRLSVPVPTIRFTHSRPALYGKPHAITRRFHMAKRKSAAAKRSSPSRPIWPPPPPETTALPAEQPEGRAAGPASGPTRSPRRPSMCGGSRLQLQESRGRARPGLADADQVRRRRRARTSRPTPSRFHQVPQDRGHDQGRRDQGEPALPLEQARTRPGA